MASNEKLKCRCPFCGMLADMDSLLQPTLYTLEGKKQTWGGKRPMTDAELMDPRRHHKGTNPGKIEYEPTALPLSAVSAAITKKAKLWLGKG